MEVNLSKNKSFMFNGFSESSLKYLRLNIISLLKVLYVRSLYFC